MAAFAGDEHCLITVRFSPALCREAVCIASESCFQVVFSLPELFTN